ncbi:hypothetical protein [Brevundimonas sp.]|uniref:hypothetical protein n=1 Tax=Brevundimonas sp. TaxID=1871086 RepID=UPI0035ADFF84
MTLTALLLLAALQDAGQAIVIAPETPAPAADNWRRIASSATRAYFVNIGGKTEAGGVTRVNVAAVPLEAEDAGDQSHMLDTYEVRCAAAEYRIVRSVDILADGAEDAPFDDPEAAWEDVPAGGIAPAAKQLACGEADTEEGYPTLAGFMAKR